LRRPARRRKKWAIAVRLLGILAGMGVLAVLGYSGVFSSWTSSQDGDLPLISPARKATLRITVTERGNLESTVTVDGVCELNATEIKIIKLVPEGTRVKKGDVVCQFDSSAIDKSIAEQDIKVKQAVAKIETTQQEREIQRNKGESDIIAAKVEMVLAKLDLEKYQKGDYLAETTKQRGEIRLKEKDLKEAKNKLEQYQQLMKKGFKSQQEVVIQEAAVAQTEFLYESSKLELKVKESYEYKKKTTEFSSKADQAQKKIEQAEATLKAQLSKTTSEVEAAKATADLEQQQLRTFQKQKEKTVITAGQEGVVAYANDAWYDSSRQIREGAAVYSHQRIFSLPDMSKMQVKLNVHESLIKKIKPGQKVEIRIESFPSILFIGTVTKVSQLADSTRPWLTGGVKQYPTVVNLDDLKGQDIKPGMTAEAKVLVGELDNVLLVPVQAVAEHNGEFFAFVSKGGKIDIRKVKVGENNETHVQITQGLTEGEHVALDARTRSAAHFKLDDQKQLVEGTKTPEPATPTPAAKP
jgi:RND family efflux transporter MFP subunit